MRKLDKLRGVGVLAFALLPACQEWDLPIGEIPGDGGEFTGGGVAGTTGASPAGASPGGSAGRTDNEGVRYGSLTPASITLLKSADANQPTPPVIAATEDGVIVAGASADPATVGVASFAPGVESEAFVGHLTLDGFVWTKPLLSSGLPGAIAPTPNGEFVIEGSYLPDEARVSPKDVSTSRVLYRVGTAGVIDYDTRITFDVETVGTSLAVSSDGSIFFGGGADVFEPLLMYTNRAILVKCDQNGVKLWEQFMVAPPDNQATVTALAALPNDDVLVAGNFGLDETTLHPEEPGTPSAIVRLTPDGDLIWRVELSGIASASALLALEDGSFLATGSSPYDFTIGDTLVDVPDVELVPGEPPSFTSFVARFDADGALRWITLDPDSFWPLAVTKDDQGTAFVALEPNWGQGRSEHVYLRSFALSDGAPLQSYKTTGSEYTFANSVSFRNGRVWVAGAFRGTADFGGGAVYEDPAGVFVAHLEAE